MSAHEPRHDAPPPSLGQRVGASTEAPSGAPGAVLVAVCVTVPLHLAPVGNRREHHYTRRRRVAREIAAVLAALQPFKPPPLPVTILLVRVGWNRLDADGLVGACKSAGLDAVSTWLGVDDRSPLLHWHLAQTVTRGRRFVRDSQGYGRWETACMLRVEVRSWHPEDSDDELRVLARGKVAP